MAGFFIENIDNLLNFAEYFAFSLFSLFVFGYIYCKITPFDELSLIKQGKVAPAISFGGVLIGFILPVASAVSNSISFYDMVFWAIVSLTVQLIIFFILSRFILSNYVKDIENDKISCALFYFFYSIGIGILNAAAITY